MNIGWLIDSFACGGGTETRQDQLQGNRGKDVIYGSFGDDVISGGRNRDIIIGGKGSDVVDGNEGKDIIYSCDDTIIEPLKDTIIDCT